MGLLCLLPITNCHTQVLLLVLRVVHVIKTRVLYEAVTPHESRLSRTMSPIAVVVILLDDIASVSPLDLVKRTSIPTIVTWLVLILAFQKLGSHFKSVTPQAQSLHCQASVNLPAFLVNHLLCW